MNRAELDAAIAAAERRAYAITDALDRAAPGSLTHAILAARLQRAWATATGLQADLARWHVAQDNPLAPWLADHVLDPAECVAYWEREHAHAVECFQRLVALDVSGYRPEDVEATYDGGRLLIRDAYRQLQAARRRAIHREHNVAPLPAAPLSCTRRRSVRANAGSAVTSPAPRRAATAATQTRTTRARPSRLPLCGDETAVRPRCPLCRGLGYVGRERRNRWKRGQR